MSLTIGSRLGPYEIVAALGAGGMGEVYRATDTNLGREVAIKVLPDGFAQDVDRLARFEREARALAALNHSNIAQIYGVERAQATYALVMELVPGPDLSERLSTGPLPVPDALAMARQIAAALEAAHEAAIVHRDLKPANVKVRDDGTVKVLDFGLAKALEPVGTSSPSMSQSTTITTPAMTQIGRILGTAAYMSPEQAKGRPVDKRADIWAFGCVLYEMLTGKRAFAGHDVSETLASVLAREPDWGALPASTPAAIRHLLMRCLERDRARRLDSAAAARIWIEDADAEAATVASTAPRRSRWPVAAALVAMALVAAVFATLWLRSSASSVAPETRLDIATPRTSSPTSFALSPDGRQIVFVASGDGASRLWLRRLAASEARPLDGTEGASDPFWSPDSRSVAFFAAGELKRLDLAGGQAQTLAPVGAARGGSWGADSVILFAGSNAGGLRRVAASAGPVAPATTVDPLQTSHRFPSFLPDGRQFLFFAQASGDKGGIFLGSVDSNETTHLVKAEWAGAYLSGHVLWIRGNSLVAQRLDLAAGRLVGDVTVIATGVAFDAVTNRSAVSTSHNGVAAYRAGPANRRQLTWFDRTGSVLGTLGDPSETAWAPRLSPDDQHLSITRVVGNNSDIWRISMNGRAIKLTSDPAHDRNAVWSPDGSRIVFDSSRNGPRDLFVRPSDGSGVDELLLSMPSSKVAHSWYDGFIAYHTVGSEADIWILPLTGDRTPFAFQVSPANERFPQFSPNGRWIAYSSNESAREEIYMRAFVRPGDKSVVGGPVSISTAGGFLHRWRPDGREIFYVARDGYLMAVPITETGHRLEVGAPVRLFRPPIVGGAVDSGLNINYNVSRDGRFLVNVVQEIDAAPITLLQNWTPGAK